MSSVPSISSPVLVKNEGGEDNESGSLNSGGSGEKTHWSFTNPFKGLRVTWQNSHNTAKLKEKWSSYSPAKKRLIIGGTIAAVIAIVAGVMIALAATGHFPQLQNAWNHNIKPFFTNTVGPAMEQHANILIPVGTGVGGIILGAGAVAALKHKRKPTFTYTPHEAKYQEYQDDYVYNESTVNQEQHDI